MKPHYDSPSSSGLPPTFSNQTGNRTTSSRCLHPSPSPAPLRHQQHRRRLAHLGSTSQSTSAPARLYPEPIRLATRVSLPYMVCFTLWVHDLLLILHCQNVPIPGFTPRNFCCPSAPMRTRASRRRCAKHSPRLSWTVGRGRTWNSRSTSVRLRRGKPTTTNHHRLQPQLLRSQPHFRHQLPPLWRRHHVRCHAEIALPAVPLSVDDKLCNRTSIYTTPGEDALPHLCSHWLLFN